MKCPKCGKTNHEDIWHCDCGYAFKSYDLESSASKQSIGKKDIAKKADSEMTITAVQVLKFFAWLDLLVGIIGSIIIWANYGKTVSGYYSSITELNPIGIGLGFAILFQGIFCCAFFLVIAQIAENISSIKISLLNKSSAA